MRATMIASIFTASVLLAAADLYTGPVAAATPVLVAQKAQAEIAAAEQIVASATQQQQQQMLTGQTGIGMAMQQQAQQQMLTGQTGVAMAMQQQAQQQQAQQQMLTGQTGIGMAMQQQAHQAAHQQQAISASDAAISAASSAQQSSSAAAHLAAVSAMNAMASSSSSQWDTSLGSTWGTNIPAQVWTQYMYPWSSTDQANLASWGQFASSAWNLAGQQGANWDSWFASNFNNGWLGDWGIHSNMLGNGDLLSSYMNGNGHLFGNAGMRAFGNNMGGTTGNLETLLEQQSMLGGNMNGAGALLGNGAMFGATSPFGLTSTHFPSWVESSAMSTWQLWNALLNSQWTSRYFGNGASVGLGQVPSFGAPQTSIGAANAALSAVEQLASAAALGGGFAQTAPATYVVDNANGNGYYAGSGYAPGSGNAYWSGNGNNGNGNGNGYWAGNGNSGYWSGNGNGYSGSGYYGNGNGYSGNGNGYSGNGFYGNGYSGSGYYGSGNGYSGNGNGYSGSGYYGNGNGYSGSGYYGNGNGYSGNGYWNQNYGSGYSGSGNGYWGNNGYGSGYGNGYSGNGYGYGYNGYGSGYSGTGQSTCVQTQVGQTNATLTCPNGMVISSITAAAWGQTPGQCPSPNVNGYCTMNVTQTIAKSCLNTNTCNVGATTMVLGSPTNNGQQCVTVSGGGMFVQPGQAVGSNTNPDTLTVAYTCAVAGATPFGLAGGTAGNMLGTGSLSFMPSPADTATPSAVIVTVVVAALALAAL